MKMPCAVSGRRYAVELASSHRADLRLEHEVELARLGEVAVRRLARPLARLPAALRVLELVGAEPELAGAAVDERVGEAGDVAGGLPDGGVEDDRRVEGDDVVALLHHRLEPELADVVLREDAVVAVVVRRAEPAVDLGGGEDEAAPPAERHDLVHRHGAGRLGHLPVTVSGWRKRPRSQPWSGRESRFSLHEYEHDPGADSYGLEAAEKLGVDPARLFKTLVADVDGVLTVACVPAASQLDLKSLGKRAQLADKTHAERATGYVSGGISPLGQRRRLPTHDRLLRARARDDPRQRGPARAPDRARPARPRAAHRRRVGPIAARYAD